MHPGWLLHLVEAPVGGLGITPHDASHRHQGLVFIRCRILKAPKMSQSRLYMDHVHVHANHPGPIAGLRQKCIGKIRPSARWCFETAGGWHASVLQNGRYRSAAFAGCPIQSCWHLLIRPAFFLFSFYLRNSLHCTISVTYSFVRKTCRYRSFLHLRLQ